MLFPLFQKRSMFFNNYRVAGTGRNFDDYPGFQHKIPFTNYIIYTKLYIPSRLEYLGMYPLFLPNIWSFILVLAVSSPHTLH